MSLQQEPNKTHREFCDLLLKKNTKNSSFLISDTTFSLPYFLKMFKHYLILNTSVDLKFISARN